MYIYLIYIFLLFNCASARPRYVDLEEEEDKQLFRAAYETPLYDHDEYEEEDDLTPGKLDLLKDGMWALKAKVKQLKAFDKALAANLLSTKLKLKDLLENHLKPLKKHHHPDDDKKKPIYGYNYQVPSYQPHPQYDPQYAAPQYGHDPYYGH